MQSRSATHAKGIDVSHWQGIIDWKKVRGAGYSFAFLKATEGSRIVDDRFRANAQDAKNAGLLVGAYHFTRAASTDDVKNEVDHFLQVIESAGGCPRSSCRLCWISKRRKARPRRGSARS